MRKLRTGAIFTARAIDLSECTGSQTRHHPKL
jgi:hypothetical protein